MGEKLSFSLRLLCISMFTVSCAIDIDVTDLTRASSTLNFENPEDFIYDANYVEISDNRISLKPLDLTDSGDDFSRGNHVGSNLSDDKLSLKASQGKHLSGSWTPESDDILIHFKFDERKPDQAPISADHEDFSGNDYHLTSFGSPEFGFVGKIGSALLLDGVSDYTTHNVSVGPLAEIDLESDFTMTIWVYFDSQQPTTSQIYNNPLYINGSGSPYLMDLRIHNQTSGFPGLVQAIRWNGTSVASLTSQSLLKFNTYNHIAIVKLKNELSLFINGQLENSAPDVTPEATNVSRIDFGGLPVGRRMKGAVDEFGFWKSALNEADISRIYQAQAQFFAEDTALSSAWTPKFDSIVGYWKMDGNWQDSSGNGNHGMKSSGSVIDSPDSQVGSQSAKFSRDLNSSLDVDPLNISGEYTVAAWVKVDDFGPVNNALNLISQKVSGAAPQETVFQLRTLQDGNAQARELQLVLHQPALKILTSGSSNILSLGQWHHLAGKVTLEGAPSMSIFIDGKKVGQQDLTGFVGYNTTGLATHIGGDGISYPGPNGFIDDLAVWNTSLTDAEITFLYERQKQKYAGHYDSEVIDLGSITSDRPDLSWSTSLPFGKELVGDFDNGGNPDSESSSDYSALNDNLTSGLTGYWPLNEVGANSAPGGRDLEDMAGGDLHLNMFSSPQYSQKSPLGNGVSFLGPSGQGVTGYHRNLNGPQFSVSTWVKATGGSGKYRFPIINRSQTNLGGGFFNLYGYNLVADNNDNWEAWIGSGKNVNGWNLVVGPQVVYGEWVHLYMGYDGSKMEFYINGSKVGENITTYTSNPVDKSPDFIIGACGSNDCPHGESFLVQGQVAAWDRPLSATEIQQLYRRGANRVKFQVKSCVDSSCNCKSFSAAPPGSVNDCDGDGTVNAEDSDDIYQAEFMGPGGDGTTYFSELMNRKVEDIVFDCDANTSDSDDSICNQDEILLTGSPKPTSPMFSFDDYLGSVKPQPNRYFQYRVNMEADENTACDGEPCLPELTSVSLAKDGESRYYGTTQVVESRYPIAYNDIESVSLEASTCVEFQLSPDKETYYFWNGKEWTPAASDENRSTASELESNITKYSDQFRKTNLYFKAFLSSDTTTPCDLGKIDLDYRELF